METDTKASPNSFPFVASVHKCIENFFARFPLLNGFHTKVRRSVIPTDVSFLIWGNVSIRHNTTFDFEKHVMEKGNWRIPIF